MSKRQNVVLGAGIAGVAAAYRAKQAGRDAAVFEASSRPGGLLDNFVIDGFRFDTAVHLSFASEPEVRAVFDQVPYGNRDPRALCRDRDLWLRHPVQNNLYPLPASDKCELISGLVEQEHVGTENYRDWLVSQYGEPIANRFPITYNEKYWAVPVESLGTKWVGPRMRKSDIREVLRGAFSQDETNTYYVKEMRYPENGGYRAFMEPMIEAADIAYNRRAEKIDVQERCVFFADGTSVLYDGLVSTIPLPVLVDLIGGAPEEIKAASDSLFATSVDLISIGFNKPDVSPALWFYIYDKNIAASRAYSPDWKSKNNVPSGCSALQFEIYSSTKRPQTMTPDEMKANTVEAVKSMGLANEADMLFVHHMRLPYGNVVFDLGMEGRRDKVRDWVTSHGIHSAGRFGEWDYLWSNQSMMSGMRAAEKAFLA